MIDCLCNRNRNISLLAEQVGCFLIPEVSVSKQHLDDSTMVTTGVLKMPSMSMCLVLIYYEVFSDAERTCLRAFIQTKILSKDFINLEFYSKISSQGSKAERRTCEWLISNNWTVQETKPPERNSNKQCMVSGAEISQSQGKDLSIFIFDLFAIKQMMMCIFTLNWIKLE